MQVGKAKIKWRSKYLSLKEKNRFEWRSRIKQGNLILYKWVGRVDRTAKKKYENAYNFDEETSLTFGQSSVLLLIIKTDSLKYVIRTRTGLNFLTAMPNNVVGAAGHSGSITRV